MAATQPSANKTVKIFESIVMTFFPVIAAVGRIASIIKKRQGLLGVFIALKMQIQMQLMLHTFRSYDEEMLLMYGT